MTAHTPDGGGLTADELDPRPCNGRNSNICVAEGCYNEACLDLDFKKDEAP